MLPGAKVHAVEQRVAIALGPERTTVWTSLRFEGESGPVGIVIPVPPGAALDTTSDAWFEALEIATAPRVFPPEGVSAACPGEDEAPSDFHMTGLEEHVASLTPAEIAVLSDPAAVSQWADLNGLDVAPELAFSLSQAVGQRFLVARFNAPGTMAVTPALRVVLPGSEPTLPLALVRAEGGDLLVTTWVLGAGVGSFLGAGEAKLEGSELLFNAKTGGSSYADALMTTLTEMGPKSVLLEGAGHEALASNVAIADGTAAIDGVITTFFERAAAYGNGSPETQGCIAKAASALASVTPVGASCPRADLGVVDGSDTCVEQPGGFTDPEALRCGAGTDDLAVALAGLVPAEVWLTRRSMRVPAGATGHDYAIDLAKGQAVTPVLEASGVDLSECNGGAGGSGAGGSSGSSGGSSSGSTSGGNTSGSFPTGGSAAPDVYVGTEVAGCGCAGTHETIDWEDSSDETVVDEEDEYDAYDGGDDCSGGSTDTGSDNCSGDTSAPPSDDCSGDGSDSYSGGDDCDSGSSGSGDDCDSGSSGGGEDCDSGSSGGGEDCDSGAGSGSEVDCSGGSGSSGGECSIASKGRSGGAKRKMPRLSAMTLGMLAFIAPLRRLGTRKRRDGTKKDAR